jgi:hypothetical protein
MRLLLGAVGCLSLAAGGCTSKPGPEKVSPSFVRELKESSEVDYKDPAVIADYFAKRNAYMATCMKDQGFDYRPYVPVPQPYIGLHISEEEFAAKYGFGITTLIDFWVPGTQRVDPNDVAAQHMEPAARKSFMDQRAQCEYKAMMEIGPPPGGGPGAVSKAELDLIQSLEHKVTSDPRMVAAKQDRDLCLAKQGFPSDDEWVNPITAKAEPYIGVYQKRVYDLEMQGVDTSRLRIEDVLTPEQMDQLRQLQVQEIAMAVARLPCEKPYYATHDAIYTEYLDQALAGAVAGSN